MWDLKLLVLDLFLNFVFSFNTFFFFLINFFDIFLQKGLLLLTSKVSFVFPQNMLFLFSLKFFACIAFLVLIRGGTPRYRYDYLTKLGWLKFLSLIILIFTVSLLFFFLF